MEEAKLMVDSSVTIFWMRRDLRLKDNAAFYHALRNSKKVLPLFIFDEQILMQLDDKADKRVEFIHSVVAQLNEELEALRSGLLVLYGDPVEIFHQLHPASVYANHDYEDYALRRDEKIRASLSERKIAFITYKDHVIFEKNEVTKKDGSPYTVFTPYSKQWKATLTRFYLKSYPTEKYFTSLLKLKRLPVPAIRQIGFDPAGLVAPKRLITATVIRNYDKTRDLPAVDGTSRLSVHLRFGTVSIRQLVRYGMKTNQTWLNELIWREFYSMILWHFPHVERRAFKPAYDNIQWRNNEHEFQLWCDGNTGYPLVDAGMRELNTTGFMHNRVRMVTASFLTKDLLIDWRWGEAYFAQKLLDFDLASNNGGWQWAAGSGCDAAPYFRIFNPTEQQKRFDPGFEYIRRWVPEFGTNGYAKPMVDHSIARARVLAAYKIALKSDAMEQ
jgi:deoxyribodipyrimidine photo-lyase